MFCFQRFNFAWAFVPLVHLSHFISSHICVYFFYLFIEFPSCTYEHKLTHHSTYALSLLYFQLHFTYVDKLFSAYISSSCIFLLILSTIIQADVLATVIVVFIWYFPILIFFSLLFHFFFEVRDKSTKDLCDLIFAKENKEMKMFQKFFHCFYSSFIGHVNALLFHMFRFDMFTSILFAFNLFALPSLFFFRFRNTIYKCEKNVLSNVWFSIIVFFQSTKFIWWGTKEKNEFNFNIDWHLLVQFNFEYRILFHNIYPYAVSDNNFWIRGYTF